MPAQSDNSQLSTLNAQLLKQYWGYDSFRGIQEEIINSISENKDTLGLMPTGGGKSITFQVPALAKDGLCLVITPLIALMKDQVQNLRKRGIKALSIYSGMSRQDIITTLELHLRQLQIPLHLPRTVGYGDLPHQTPEDEGQHDYGRRKPLHLTMGI